MGENEMHTLGAKNASKCYYPDFSRKLVCIQYPGVVNNVDKMLETLGGLPVLESVVANTNKKLDLRFSPKDVFRKACSADREYKPGILLKVKMRRRKIDKEEKPGPSKQPESPVEIHITNYEVVGVSVMSFKFNRLSDFQYLPLVPEGDPAGEEKDTPLEYIYDKIFPDQLPDMKWLRSEEAEKMPLYLPPPIFSRFSYSYNKLHFEKSDIYNSTFRPELGEQLMKLERRSKNEKAIDAAISNAASIIASNRRSRKTYAPIVNFNEAEVPMQAPEEVNSLLKLGLVKKVPVERLERLFEERPIWSKAAISYKTGIAFGLLKYVLPSMAYHFVNGPWRPLWVRYGYDPRKDPKARIYQTFDFRVREIEGFKNLIKPKRPNLSTSKMEMNVEKFSLKENLKSKSSSSFVITEASFVLRPGMMPPARQIFYMYCDVLLPEVQSMLARLPEVRPGTVCDIKNGWLPQHFHDQCREIASRYIQQQAKKEFLERKEKLLARQMTDEVDGSLSENSEDEERIVIDDDTMDVEMDIPNSAEDDQDIVIDYTEEWNSDAEEIDMDVVEEVNQIIYRDENVKQDIEEPCDSEGDAGKDTVELFTKMLDTKINLK